MGEGEEALEHAVFGQLGCRKAGRRADGLRARLSRQTEFLAQSQSALALALIPPIRSVLRSVLATACEMRFRVFAGPSFLAAVNERYSAKF